MVLKILIDIFISSIRKVELGGTQNENVGWT